jgi:RNA polymerase sigma-70 factor, ECF subfamily
MKDPDDHPGAQHRGAAESTSWSLLDRVKRGEPEGWQRLVNLYSPLVVAQCRRERVTGADANEIVQEVFTTLVHKIEGFQKQPGPSFRSWLRTITRHKLGDHFRRLQRPARGVGGTDAKMAIDQLPDPVGESIDETDEHDASDRRLLCRQALRLIRPEFHPRSWQAVWRVVVDNQRPADVAALLGMTVNAVYVGRSRILGRLREVLVDLGESEFDADPLTASVPELE